MKDTRKNISDKLTRAEKNRNDKQWYKDKTRSYDVDSEETVLSLDYHQTRKSKMQTYYNLKNNI